MSWNVVLDVAPPVSLSPRKLTPVVTGVPSGKVASGTVKGLNGFAIGTLMPLELKAAPFFLNGSGENPVAAPAKSKNERVYLKSANTVKYLSQISRVKEPYKLWRSAAGIDAVTAAELYNVKFPSGQGTLLV